MNIIAIIAAIVAAIGVIFGQSPVDRIEGFMERFCPAAIADVNAIGGVVEAIRPIDPDAQIRQFAQIGRQLCDIYGGTAPALQPEL